MKQVFKHFLISTALLFASLGAFAGGDATVIYKLDGNASSADVVGIVTYSSSNGTITVTPKDGNYLEATDLTVYKMIDGQYAQGRTREPNYMTPVAVTATNSGADPSKTTTYTITVPGDEYDYEITANFHPRTSVENATVTGLADSYTYTGEPIKPVVTVKVGGNTLTLGTDYRAFYADSINASTDQVKGMITLYGIRKYTGTKQINYTIAKADPTLTFSSATATYTYGQAFTQPTLTTTPTGLAVKYTSSNTNVADVDQSTGAITAKAASTEAITITASFAGNDNYNAEEATYSLTVAKGSATLATPPAAIANLTYNGQNQALITAGSATNGTLKYSLTGGDATDFSETIPTGKEAKTYTIYYKVEGNDNYNGTESASLDVTIGVKTVSAPTIILSETSFEYDGTAKQPTVTVKDGDTEIQSTEYTVSYSNNTNVAASTDNKAPTVTITDKDGGNYTVSGSTTFSITAADGVVTPPTAIANLTYTGQNQALINAGSSTTGTVKYSLTGADATDYSETVPTGKDAKTYIIYYKVEGDANHKDVAPTSINVTIAAKTVSEPTISLSQTSFVYDGTAKEPTVTVKDEDTEIPSTEYTVSYTNNTDAAAATDTKAPTVTITDKDGGNYTVSGSTTFTILAADGSLTLPTAIANLTYNGQNQALINAGSSATGTMKYSLTAEDATDYSEDIPTGKDAKTYTVYYKVEGDGNHNDIAPASLEVTIAAKTVSTPTITLSQTSFVYDGTAKQPTVTMKDGDTEIPSTEYTVSYTNNTDVAASTDNKAPTVTITDKDGGNYTVSGSKTFSITAADGVVTPPTAIANLTYTGQNQALINAGSSTTGTVKYSLTGADATDYSETVPTGKDAKTYIIYYKVEGDANHKDVAPTSINVTIAAKTVSKPTISLSQTSFVYDGTAKQPTVTVKDKDTEIPSAEYTVSYTNNTDAAAATDSKAPTVTITDKDGGNYTVSGSTTFTILAADGSLTLPTAIEGLTYNGQNQALITAGSSATGTMKYSLTAEDATDYSEDIPTGKDAKTYTVYYKVEGDANHNDIAPASLEVTIAAKTVSTPTITLSQTSFVYDGSAKQPTVTVKDGNTEIPSTEYTVSYTNNTDVAASTDNKAPTVTITDKDGGNYTVSGSTTFSITAKETTPTVTLATTSYVYDGTAKEPAVTVTIPGEGENADPVTLTSNDYTVAYSDNTNAGTNTAKATVTLKGNYSGSGSATFTIGQATIDAVTLSATQLIYSGSDQTVTVTKVMAGTLEVASDFYTVSGNTGKEPGTYTVTVTAKTDIANNFKGEVTAQFAIINRTATEEELGIAAGQTYGTYINLTEDLLLPETVVAYIITDCDGKTVTATEIGYIPKDVPVLLEKKTATTRPEGVPQTDGNMLKYAANNTSVNRSEGTVYLLYNGQFVRATNNSVSAKHIYLQLAANTGNGARALGIRHGDESTGIGAVFNDERIMNNDKWYDLQGQRIEKPTKKGLYIHQGKKVVIK